MGVACCKDRPSGTLPLPKNKLTGTRYIEPLSLKLVDLQIKKELKKGTLGRSYKVFRKETGEYFAMKVINKATLENTGLQYKKNYKITIFSPFCVHLQSSFEESEYVYSVVDFVEGTEVLDELKKSSKFNEDTSRFFIAQAILALQELHSQNIVYRNLNPERMLIDSDGHLKLVDFGVYSIFQWPVEKKMGTMSEAIDYKSPQQVREVEFDFRSDLWQLGICLYEMLSGKSPFIHSERKVMEDSILKDIPVFDSNFSDSARDLIIKLLRKNVGHLYLNAGDRIGASGGKMNDIKQHAFFKKINWGKMEHRRVPPPFKPEVSNV